jgi:hypothetical protein
LPEKAILRTLLDVVLQFQQKLGADERTRTAFLLQLRVITQALQGFAINSWWRWIKTITVCGRLCKLGRQGFQRKE